MTEPIFKAPLPPSESGFTPPPAKTSEDSSSSEKVSLGKSSNLKQKLLPYLWYILGGTFVIGLIFGGMMSGGDSAPTTPEYPLKYVGNPDIQKAFPLCGLTAKTNECVLFIMNTDRTFHYADDYFTEAARLTGRNRLLISTDNPTYSKFAIEPGWFAQIKIPAMR